MQPRYRLLLTFCVLASTLYGCSAPSVRAYSGAKLATDEVSVLMADDSASPRGVSLAIRRVNGVDTVRNGTPKIEVPPGTQIVQVEIVESGSKSNGLAESRSYTTLTFDTLAGQSYRVQGTLQNGLGKAWVIGENDAPISVHSPSVNQ